MPLTKDFYEGTPGQDMTYVPELDVYAGYTMDGQRVEVGRVDYEADARNHFNTNLAWWWLLNRPQKVRRCSKP